MNRAHSEQFLREQPKRRDFLRKHPVQIAGVSCMDGRTKLSSICGMRYGFIRRQWRTLGGVVDLGAPRFGASVENWRHYADKHGHEKLALIGYHFSGSDNPRLGCRGHNHDKGRAIGAAIGISEQFARVYGNDISCPVIGVDTDFDQLYIHDAHSEIIDASDLGKQSETFIRERLEHGFPEMPEVTRDALSLIVRGNADHVAEVRAANRPIEEAQHHEYSLVIGEGIWADPNTAIVVGPYTLDMTESISIAAGLLWDNFNKGRANGNDPVLFSCAVHRDCGNARDSGIAKRAAIEEAQCFKRFAKGLIAAEVPELAVRLTYQPCIMSLDTRLLELV